MLASADEIPPGGEGEIKVIFKTYLDAGRNTKAAMVYTNSKTMSAARLEVSARVTPAFKCTPGIVDFGNITRDFGGTQVVKIDGYGFGKVNILDVVTESPFIEAAMGADGRSIEVALLPGHKVGRLTERIRFVTDSELMKFVPAVSVTAKIKGRLSVAPQLVDFDYLVAKGASQTHEVLVTGKGTFKLKSAEVDNPGITTDITPVKGGYKVILEAKTNFKNAKLVLKTDDADQPELLVHLFGKTTSP